MTTPRPIATPEHRDRTIHHLHALATFYTRAEIGRLADLNPLTVGRMLDGDGVNVVLVGTADKILALPLPAETLTELHEATREHVTLLAQHMSQREIARRCQASPETVRRALEEPWRLRREVCEKLRAIPIPPPPPEATVKPKPRLHRSVAGKSWGEVRRLIARLACRGMTTARIAELTGLPELRVRDALAGITGPRTHAHSWPPTTRPAPRTSTRGRAA